MPEEVSTKNRSVKLRIVSSFLLLWAVGAVALVLMRSSLDSKQWNSAVAGVVLVVITVTILVARSLRLANKKQCNTMVCDQCNTLKLADGNCECECGGHFWPMPEMKWTSYAPKPDTWRISDSVNHGILL